MFGMKRLRIITAALLIGVSTPASATGLETAALAIGGWYATIGATGQLAVQVGIGLALSAASYGLSYLLSGGGKRQQQSQQDNLGIQIEELSGLLERRRIYGTCVVSGGVFFQKTTGGSSGKRFFLKGFTLSDGICDGLESIIINGVECPLDSSGNPQIAPWYNASGNKMRVSFRSGTDDQAMDTIIAARFASPPDDFYPDDANRVTKWAAFRQRGVATVVVEMDFGTDADTHTELWGVGGVPDLKFKVRGLRVYDSRDSNQSATDSSTWGYSSNAALVEADWLTSDMGFGIDPSEIDWDSVGGSATFDDRWMQTLAGSERRGRINGLVLGSEANDDVLKSMALQNRAIIRRAFGRYTIKADSFDSDPVRTIHQGILIGGFSFQNEPDTRAAVNRAEVQFSPATKQNQSAETFYEDAALITLDGQTLPQRSSLKYCDSSAAAQRLAYGTIKDNRAGRTFSGNFDISVLNAPGKPNGQLLEAGDVVRLDFRNYDQMNGLYRVTDLEINQDFSVSLAMAGYDPDAITGWHPSLETPFEEAA